MYHTVPDSPAQHHVDGLLKSFFKKQLPDPWPEARIPQHGPGVTLGRPWFSNLGRLALVASVALLLFGYLGLAARFPVANEESGLSLDRSRTIGLVPGVKLREPTPRGGEALIWEWTFPAPECKRPTTIMKLEYLKEPQP
jgi:hypothetical protein